MIQFREIALGDGGPGCARCGRSRPASYRSADDLFATLAEEASSVRLQNLAFVGPDALACDVLEALATAALKAGVERLRVDVSAEGLTQDAERLLALDVRHVRFSLLEAATDPTRSADTIAGVRAFAEAASEQGVRIATTAVLPLCRHTIQDAPGAAMIAAEARADSILLLVDDPTLDLCKAAPWVMAACDTGMVNVVWVEVEGIPFCFMDGYELHLANAVRSHPGCKPDTCGKCAVGELCDGVVPDATPAVLGSIRTRSDNEALAARLRRSREKAPV